MPLGGLHPPAPNVSVAKLQSAGPVQTAIQAYEERARALAAGPRASITVSWPILPVQALYVLVKGMGIQIFDEEPQPGTAVVPPYALVQGTSTQTSLLVTWRLRPTTETSTFELHKRKGVLVLKGKRAVVQSRIALLPQLLWALYRRTGTAGEGATEGVR